MDLLCVFVEWRVSDAKAGQGVPLGEFQVRCVHLKWCGSHPTSRLSYLWLIRQGLAHRNCRFNFKPHSQRPKMHSKARMKLGRVRQNRTELNFLLLMYTPPSPGSFNYFQTHSRRQRLSRGLCPSTHKSSHGVLLKKVADGLVNFVSISPRFFFGCPNALHVGYQGESQRHT